LLLTYGFSSIAMAQVLYKGPTLETGLTTMSLEAAAAVPKKGSTLYVSPDCQDYVWRKVALAASLVGEPLNSIKLSAGDFASLAPHARSCVLVPKSSSSSGAPTPGLCVSGPNACARYLCGLREDLGLMGGTDFEAAKVEQWLDFSWHELEVVLVACTTPASEDEPAVDEQALLAYASADVAQALGALNSALVGATYLASPKASKPTLADAAAIAVVAEVITSKPNLLQGAQLPKSMPHLVRWFMTCASSSAFSAVLGPKPVDAMRKLLGDKGAPVKVGVSAKGKAEAGKEAAAGKAAPGTKAPAVGLKAVTADVPALNLKFKRTRTRIVDIVKSQGVGLGDEVTVKGWARTVREANKGKLLFIVLNDGSTPNDLQCVVDATVPGFASCLPSACGGTGASFSVTGAVVASGGKGQALEIQAKQVALIGAVFGGEGEGLTVGGAKYPLSKKGHSFEYMRKMAHLRARTKAYASTQRLRHAMAYATHEFFNERGFLYVHTPLVTGADCEGAGEMFAVTTMLPKDPKGDLPRLKNGEVDYSKDFFGGPAGLTVSGQLNVETHACALSDVYTFGPTFRAEDSHTSRHLAEFWMIEPEIAFAGLQEDMDLAEDYLKHCVHYALSKCMDDLETLQAVEGWDAELVPRLKNLLERPFTRLTYTEAIALLEKEVKAGRATFEEPVSWGIDMASEHERFLAEKLFKGPVIVTNYPKDIKAFYMKLDESGKTVQAMDILVPRIGEIIGGSVREDDFTILKDRAAACGVSEEQLGWYLDLRKYGTVPHAGFGLGFERLVMLVTGVENIRDTIPFPRYPGHCEF